MPPRTAFAFGFALGLLAVYFIGLVQGLSLGTLLWRSGLGAVGFGAFCSLLVFLLGDPLEIPNDEDEEEGDEDHEEGHGREEGRGREREERSSSAYGQGDNPI